MPEWFDDDDMTYPSLFQPMHDDYPLWLDVEESTNVTQ